jgi:lipoprotein-anchoring transpeptidase ErfK/SrfK
MIRSLVLPIALLAVAASCAPLLAQDTPGDAAEAAQAVAARADGAFERVDPDNELAPVIEAAAPDQPALTPALVYADLPPIAGGDAVTYAANDAAPDAASEPARGPAARMIASNDPFVIKSILPIEGSIRYGDWFWDESAAPQSGKLVITVDLEARVISAFRDGHEIGTAVALLGTRAHPTPTGNFPILTKERDNVSEKYNSAPMPWTLRLTWDGIAIHGSPVLNGYASHGCVGVPDEFAAKLFAAAKRGDRVIITRGRMVGLGDKVL